MSLNKILVNNTTTVNTGVVYDITKATGQSYDNLSAALGTSGNNVPPEVREGGMSIRFVSNSDNKYVQFRYMSSSTAVADFTNVNNWQGVDDKPTVISKNLVKSGGVEKNISIIGDIVEIEKRFSALIQCTISSNNSKSWALTQGAGLYLFNGVSGDENVILRAGGVTGGWIRQASLLNYSGKYYLLVTEKDITDGVTHAVIDKNNNLAVSYYKPTQPYIGFVSPLTPIRNVVAGTFAYTCIAGVYNNTGGIEVKEGELAFLYYNGSTWSKITIGLDDNLISFDKSGHIRLSDGAPVANDNYVRTDYIRVNEGDSLIYYGYAASNYAKIACYDSSKTPIQVLLSNAGAAYGRVVVMPANTAYVMCCSVASNHDSYIVPKAKILFKNINPRLLEGSIIKNTTDITDIYSIIAGFDDNSINYKGGGFGRIKTNGSVESNNNFSYTVFVPVTHNDKIVYTGRVQNGLCVAGYSTNEESSFNETILTGRGVTDDKAYTNVELSIPDGVNYIRGCFYVASGFAHSLIVKKYYTIDEKIESVEQNVSDIQNEISDIQNQLPLSFRGKRIAVIGDSIATGTRLNAYITIKEVDVGNEIQSYISWYDVYADQGDQNPRNKTIGGTAVTFDMIGTLQTFTPVAADVGKTLGTAISYYGNTNGWAYKLCQKLGATLINASWSGSSLMSGQAAKQSNPDHNIYSLSHGWSDLTIGRCRTRDNEGNYQNPDVIIICRGVNDMTHDPYVYLDADYSLNANGYPETDLYDSNKYGFYRAYYLTISKLRQAYPNAVIYCATLNTFKRMLRDRYPVRSSVRNYSVIDMNNAIRTIANNMGCGLIEFDKDGITFENCYPTYISDSADMPTHPNATGQMVMANRALVDMKYLIKVD